MQRLKTLKVACQLRLAKDLAAIHLIGLLDPYHICAQVAETCNVMKWDKHIDISIYGSNVINLALTH